MNERDDKIFKHMMQKYKFLWDANQYARTNYDTDLEYYRGYRNAADYPLAYNESFNRILPIIHTILSRFMDQIYQAGNIVSVNPRKRVDVGRAKAVEGVLNYQMENLNCIDTQGGSYLTMMKWFFNALTFGKGVVKVYWRKEERISPIRMALPIPSFDRLGNFQGMDVMDHVSQEMQTVYDGPYVEVLHNKLFLPNPEYKNIQQMPECFIVYKRRIDEVKRMADKGIYKNIKDLGAPGTSGASYQASDSREAFVKSLSIESAFQTEDGDSKYQSPEIDIVECYGKAILENAPYTVGSGYQIKGREEEIIVHIGNFKTILSLQKNTYGMRPIFDMGAYYHPELYWDLGLVTLTKGIQNQVNNLANLRIQNAMMHINQMIKVNIHSDIDPEALVWKPFGIIPVDDMDDVQAFAIPDFNSNLFTEQEEFYKHTIQDIMGMYDYGMGQTPQRQERVGVVYGIQAMGEARAKLMLMSMDYLGIRPLLKYMMVLNTFHLPSGFEYRVGNKEQQQFGNIFGTDIHSDFDFSAKYTAMEPALGKQARMDRLVQLAGLWKDNPWINQYQWNKTLMELGDIREAESLLKSPQQFQQEMQQQVKMQMMAEQQRQQYETQGKIALAGTQIEGKLKTSQKDFQEDLILGEQEFRHDMAIEAMKQEAVQ
uniref:Portal protein n=1 Tax=viral metagenome TaxID=1070528 RepID=A0A6H1ZVE3_9ZZZZ